MRTLYLIRHGEPAFPGGQKLCLSRTDLPLSTLGKLQGAAAGAFLPSVPEGNLFASPLLRTRETAAFLGRATIEEQLIELGIGEWDGLTFAQIKEKYPALYAQRGADPYHTLVPGAEAPASCKRRMLHCLDSLLGRTAGDIAVVSHSSAIRLYLCALHIAPCSDFLSLPQPYGGVTRLTLDRGVITAEYIGRTPAPELTGEFCLKLLRAAGTPENVIRHSMAVEKQALRLSEGLALDRALLSAAALLHDIARAEPFHEKAGADRIAALGYERVASLIRTHTDLPKEAQNSICESSVLYLADKTVLGETPVTLQERFTGALNKCESTEAVSAHKRRFATAEHIQSLIEERK